MFEMILFTVILILNVTVKDVLSLRVTVTQNPIGTLGNNLLNLTCTYVLEQNDIVSVITWQKKQGNTYSNDDNIATFWPPARPQNASFTQTTPGIEFSNRAELTNPTAASLTAVITINEIKCEDEAEYRCVVNYYNPGPGGTSAGATTNLTVRARPTQPDTTPIMDPSMNIVENTNANFTCTGNVGRPVGRFVWRKYKNSINQGQPPGNVDSSEKLIEGTCTYNGTSTLTYRVTRDDDLMVIRCQVEAAQGLAGIVFFRQTEQIRVYYGVTRRPDITRNPSDSAIIASQTVTLSCTASGHPAPNFIWYDKDNNELGRCGIYQIQNAQPDDSGTYTCMAYNRFAFSKQLFNESASVLVNIVSITDMPVPTTTAIIEKYTTSPTQQPQNDEKNCSDNSPIFGLLGGIIGFVLATVIFLGIPILRRRLKISTPKIERFYQDTKASSRNTEPKRGYDELQLQGSHAGTPEYVNTVMS